MIWLQTCISDHHLSSNTPQAMCYIESLYHPQEVPPASQLSCSQGATQTTQHYLYLHPNPTRSVQTYKGTPQEADPHREKRPSKSAIQMFPLFRCSLFRYLLFVVFSAFPYFIADMYELGLAGLTPDLAKARHWLLFAAAQKPYFCYYSFFGRPSAIGQNFGTTLAAFR